MSSSRSRQAIGHLRRDRGGALSAPELDRDVEPSHQALKRVAEVDLFADLGEAGGYGDLAAQTGEHALERIFRLEAEPAEQDGGERLFLSGSSLHGARPVAAA